MTAARIDPIRKHLAELTVAGHSITFDLVAKETERRSVNVDIEAGIELPMHTLFVVIYPSRKTRRNSITWAMAELRRGALSAEYTDLAAALKYPSEMVHAQMTAIVESALADALPSFSEQACFDLSAPIGFRVDGKGALVYR